MTNLYQKSFPGGKPAGFTLIELLVVVLIIGILAAVALPQYEFAVYKARLSRLLPLMKSIKHANQVFYMANGYYTNDFTRWDLDMPAGSRLELSQGDSYGRIILPDGTVFQVVSAPLPGMPRPRVEGIAKNVPARLLTFYELNEWRCYPDDETGIRLCRAVGCKEAPVIDSGGCAFSF